MSSENRNVRYSEHVRRAYRYYKRYGICGTIRNGWRWLLDKPERLTALSTLAIFVATAGAAAVGFAQWTVLSGQLIEMRETSKQTDRLIVANEKLSNAAIAQAEAAAKSAKTAEDALKLTQAQLMAYIALVPPNVFNVNTDGTKAVIYAQFVNNGQTPARNVERSIGISLNFPSSDFSEAIVEPSLININAGAVTSVAERYLPKPLTAEEFAAVKEGDIKIYVFGKIAYESLGTRRIENFCFAYFGLGENLPPSGYGYPGFTAKPCTR